MKKRGYLIISIILVILVIASFFYYFTNDKDNILKDNPVVINNDDFGVASSPMDVEIIMTQFSEEGTSEMTIRVGKREGYKTEWFEAKNTIIRISIPEGLEILNCPRPQCELTNKIVNIIGDQVYESAIQVRVVKDGEWTIEANALSTEFPAYDYVSDTEKVYILVEGKNILISDTPFSYTDKPGERAAMSLSLLLADPLKYNGSEICTSGIYLSRCELRLLAESYYTDNDYTYLTEPKVWVESTDFRKWNCFEGPPCSGAFRIERPEFCDATVCGIFEYGPLIIQTANFEGDYIIKDFPTKGTNGGEPV